MKTLILLVLAVIGAQAGIVKSSPKSSLFIGSPGYQDRLLHSTYVTAEAIPNRMQYQDVTYQGNLTTRITAIHAFEIGVSQWPSVFIVNGGIYQNNVSVRFRSAKGFGYYYQLNIWGY